jgi:hypothetical protein
MVFVFKRLFRNFALDILMIFFELHIFRALYVALQSPALHQRNDWHPMERQYNLDTCFQQLATFHEDSQLTVPDACNYALTLCFGVQVRLITPQYCNLQVYLRFEDSCSFSNTTDDDRILKQFVLRQTQLCDSTDVHALANAAMAPSAAAAAVALPELLELSSFMELKSDHEGEETKSNWSSRRPKISSLRDPIGNHGSRLERRGSFPNSGFRAVAVEPSRLIKASVDDSGERLRHLRRSPHATVPELNSLASPLSPALAQAIYGDGKPLRSPSIRSLRDPIEKASRLEGRWSLQFPESFSYLRGSPRDAGDPDWAPQAMYDGVYHVGEISGRTTSTDITFNDAEVDNLDTQSAVAINTTAIPKQTNEIPTDKECAVNLPKCKYVIRDCFYLNSAGQDVLFAECFFARILKSELFWFAYNTVFEQKLSIKGNLHYSSQGICKCDIVKLSCLNLRCKATSKTRSKLHHKKTFF